MTRARPKCARCGRVFTAEKPAYAKQLHKSCYRAAWAAGEQGKKHIAPAPSRRRRSS
jgi:hypothetical protein